jgi:hypothetical protein
LLVAAAAHLGNLLVREIKLSNLIFFGFLNHFISIRTHVKDTRKTQTMTTDSTDLHPVRIWFYMKSSKYGKMAYPAIESAASEHGCTVRKLVLDGEHAATSLAECDVLIAKATDDIVDAEHCGNTAAAARSRRLTELLAAAPHVVVVDPIATQRLVLSRSALYSSLANVAAQPSLAHLLAQPRFVVLDAGESGARCAAELTFPMVAKTDLACGTPESHHMVVARTIDELDAWLRERPAARVVVQEFVSHAATVFKCFAIGGVIGVNARPSIDAPTADEGALAFDSQLALPGARARDHNAAAAVDTAAVERVAVLVRDALATLYGFSVFGFDLLAVDGSGGRFAIVDVNYCPGFKEMVNNGSFAHELLEHAKSRLQRRSEALN